MSTPADADTQDDLENGENQTTEKSFADKVNDVVATMKLNDKGVYELPEDLPEEIKVAATAEKRLRDTQAQYSRGQQEVKALKAEKAALTNKLHTDVKPELTPEQNEELEELKFSDPETWRKKLNQYESEARTKRISEIDEELKKVSAGSLETEELERRKEVFTKFSADNPDLKLTDEVIANDIPLRITKKLETGKITFEEYLIECRDYLKAGKVVTQDETLDDPNLGKVGGGSKPGENAQKQDIVKSYEKETY